MCDGYKLLWDIMITSQPAFCPYKKCPEPQWALSQDVTTHAKRWILFFCFMGNPTKVTLVTPNRVYTSFILSKNQHFSAKSKVWK